MIELIKINETEAAECYLVENDTCEQYLELTEQGFKRKVSLPMPETVVPTDRITPYYIEEADTLMETWRIENDPEQVQQRIAELRALLASTDYQIIKALELSLVGENVPYDLQELHFQRQSWREEIGELGGNKTSAHYHI